MTTAIRPRRRAVAFRRRGVLSLEMILVLPILLIVVLATVEFGMLLASGQAVNAAASVGAREATLPGATPAKVQDAVRRAVASWRFANRLDAVQISPAHPQDARTGDPVKVTVSVDSLAAAPNLLRFVGVSLKGQKLSASFVLRKE